MTNGRGSFLIRSDFPKVERRNIFRAVTYNFKIEHSCPAPGALGPGAIGLKRFALLREGIRHRQLLVAWGVGGRGQRSASTPAAPSEATP
jgi:hypothetical protein